LDLIKAKLQEILTSQQIEQNKIFSNSSFSIITSDISVITANVPSIARLDGFIKANYLLPDVDAKIEQ
jgi:hypothetical protein